MATATRKSSKSTPTVKPSSLYAKVAEAKGVDTTRAAKLVRSFVRRHDTELREQFAWPPKAKAQADGNRYTDMPKACADHITAALSSGSKGSTDK